MGAKNTLPKDLSDKPVVVIVGGGTAGISVAKLLDESGLFNVIILERKEYYLHNVGALRSAVDRKQSDKIMIPYTNLLTNGVVLKAEVEYVAENGVKVFGREELIKYDYLIIATGSSYAFPGRVAESTAAEARKMYEQFYDIVREAQNILIVGGGPVGIELSGEIAHVYKDKKVTLLSARTTLVPQPEGFSDKFRNSLKAQAEGMGIEVILGDRVSKLEQEDKEEKQEQGVETGKLFTNAVSGKRTVITDNGRAIETDLVLFCTGIKINSKVYERTFDQKLDGQKRIKTNEHLQVDGMWNVFALGDCRADNSGMAFLAAQEAVVVAKNIIGIQESKLQPGSELPKKWTNPSQPIMAVPLGPELGTAEIAGMILGSWFVSWMKGKDLVVGKSWESLRMKMPVDNAAIEVRQPENLQDSRLSNLQAAVGWSSPDVALEAWRNGGLPAMPVDNAAEHT